MHILQAFLFWTKKFDDSPFLSQLTQERFIYLKRKLCIIANEFSFEIGKISLMRACTIKRVRPNLYGAPCNSCTNCNLQWASSQEGVLGVEMMELAVRKIKNKTNVMVPKGNSSTFNVHRSQVLLRYLYNSLAQIIQPFSFLVYFPWDYGSPFRPHCTVVGRAF